jgi:hypothetical protein
VEWGGARRLRYQNVIVPWTVLESSKDSIAFADRLADAPIHRVAGTSISEAIEFSLALLLSGDFLATRRVIDISGDGSNNQGGLVTKARDKAVARGVTINGLPIMLKEPEQGENATLDAYYRDCVIGGSNAFMIPVRERRQFLTETKAKIVREIADAAGPGSLAHSVGGRPLTDCDTSESVWDDFAPNLHRPVNGSGQDL